MPRTWAATSGAACGGGKPAAIFWLGAGARALACAPWVALRYTVPYNSSGPFNFGEGNRDAPGYPWHQRRCANKCPVSECVIPWTPFLGEEKLSPVIFKNPEGVQEQINRLQQFQMPGDPFDANLQYLLGGVREIFSGQQSLTKPDAPHEEDRSGFAQKGEQEGEAATHQHKFKYQLVVQNNCQR